MNINISALARECAGLLTGGGRSQSRASSEHKTAPAKNSPEDSAVSPRINSLAAQIGAVMGSLETATSFTQAQESYLRKVGKALERMSDLASVSLFACRTDEDRSLYNQEFVKLRSFIDETSEKSFNGIGLFGPVSLAVVSDKDGKATPLNSVDLRSPAYMDVRAAGIGNIPESRVAMKALQQAMLQHAQDRSNVEVNLSILASCNAMMESIKSGLSEAGPPIDNPDAAAENTSVAKSGILGQAKAAMEAQPGPGLRNATELLE
jgi:hypothetical protein